jgi:PAS domain S-box-containing protein
LNLDQLLGFYWREKRIPPGTDKNKWRLIRHLFPIAIEHRYRLVKAGLAMALLLFIFLVSGNLGFAVTLSAQKNLIFDRLSSQQGLSQAVVISIVQDEEGFIWLGTQEGLNRYDGYEFETFFHEPGNNGSLSHDWILDLLKDRNGTLWIATDGGLNRFNPDSNSFTRFSVGNATADSPARNESVQVLYEDRAGYLWLGTSQGLSRHLGGGRFEHYVHVKEQNTSISAGRVTAIHEDSAGNFWVGTDMGGLNLFDPEHGSFTHFKADASDLNSLTDNYVRTILEVAPGKLWIGTFNRGISVLDVESAEITPILHDPNDSTSLSSNRVRGFLKDSKGNLWVAADGGLNLWQEETGNFQRFTHDTSNVDSLSNDTVITLFEDSGGVIWVGTYSGGVSKWNNNITAFPHIRNRIDDPGSLSDNQVTSFTEGKNNSLWVGTIKGLNLWDPQTGQFSLVSQSDSNLSSNAVMSLLFDSQERLWVGTINNGVNVMEPGENYFSVFRSSDSDDVSISSNKISKIYEDTRGRIWITTYGGGVNLYREDGTFQRYPSSDSATHGFSDLRAVDIVEDHEGTLWIATDGGGVVLLEPETGITKALRNDPDDEASLSSDHVITLLRENDKVWVGTRDIGLNLFDRDSGKFKRFDKQSGLASDAIYGMLIDPHHRLWLSGNKGLSVLDPDTGEIHAYDSTHGLQSNDFNHGAFFKTSSGDFLFGGSNGFNSFDPLSIHGNDHVPEIRLTKFTKFNKPYDLGRDLSKVKIIELNYNDYVIGFGFSAMDFTAPEKNRFKYKLEGFDRDWVEVSGVHHATYTNLDSGDYTFRVIGSNNDNVWNEDGLAVALKVNPPLWATWWAYLFYFIVGIAILGSFARLHTLKLKREAEERYNRELHLYIESLEEATDCVLIADENKVLKYANNAVFSMMGMGPGEVRGKAMLSLIFSSEADAKEAQLGLAREDRWHGEVSNKRGSEGYSAEITISKVRRGASNEIAYVCIARDITERKRTEAELEVHRQKLEELVDQRTAALSREIVEHKVSEKKLANSLQEKELLLKEVHHRVKNNMQVISSLLNIQAESIEDEKFSTLLSESQQRIKSMALIHENLYQSDNLLGINFQEYIEMLGNSLCRFYASPGVLIKMNYDIDDISLDIETAVPCGLIINELVSNSLKHAYTEHQGIGHISTSFKHFEDSYILSISDDGKGMPEDFSFDNISSMGMEIICILTNQLDGNIQLIKDNGSTFRVAFPNRKELWHKQA